MRLDPRIDGQPQILSILGAVNRVSLDLLAEPVHHHLALAVVTADQVLLSGLEPGEPLVVHANGPDQRSGDLALGIDTPA